MRLTNRLIDSQTNTTDKDVFLRDSELRGFGLRITPNNVKSFFVETRVRHGGTNSAKRFVLGRYPDLSLKSAREKAGSWLAQMRQGIDPIYETKVKNRKAKEENEANRNFEDLFNTFLESRNLKANTTKDYRSTYNNHFKEWAHIPIMEISRKDVQELFSKISKVGGNAQANKSMRILNAVFNFARATIHLEGRPLIENPVSVIKDAQLKHKEVKRKTYIQSKDLEAFIKAVIKLGDHPVRDYLILLLFTGLRSREALTLTWDNVDFEQRAFTITEERAKNKEAHTIPMSRLTHWLFVNRWSQRIECNPYVFPSKTGTGHYQEPRPQIKRVSDTCGIDFTPHDLRRTFASLMDEMIGRPEIVGRLLNHKSNNITQQYIQTQAEQYRPYLESLTDYVALGYDWFDVDTVKGQRLDETTHVYGLEAALYWGEQQLETGDDGLPIFPKIEKNRTEANTGCRASKSEKAIHTTSKRKKSLKEVKIGPRSEAFEVAEFNG